MRLDDSPFEGGAGGCPVANMALESRRTPPYAPLIGGVFRGVAHAAWGGAIEHENYSPPLEGCRGGLFRNGKDPPLKAEAFFPLPGGDFQRRSAL